MTEKIKEMYEFLKKGDYKNERVAGIDNIDFSDLRAYADTFKRALEAEKPILFKNDTIGFNRHTKTFYDYPWGGNIVPNYKRVLSDGLDKTISDIKTAVESERDASKKAYGTIMLEMLSSTLKIADDYAAFAQKNGNQKLFGALSKIPRKPAENLYEALVFMKFCIFILRLGGLSHITFGRFDQYMYPFYQKSKAEGRTDEEIFELIEEFFLSVNYDIDVYFGIQQGDDGQSMVLGGFDKDGNDTFNELSKMCMQASLELSLIDPKINLRVGKNTPLELFEYATLLTKQGLGFPQYCNDDVVVPGLIRLGYTPEDAYDYAVAACWEFIIPNCSRDVPNLTALDFPRIANDAIKADLRDCETFDVLQACVCDAIAEACDGIVKNYRDCVFSESPLLSVFVDGCIPKLTDAYRHGGKYFNFGCHGTGISNAADALAAVKKTVYDEKSIDKQTLLQALDNDFEGFAEIRNALRACPKMGNNDDYVDDIALSLIDAFANNLNGKDNGHGGIWRAGTGSASMYIDFGKACPATADGRKGAQPYASGFSPSLDVRPNGLLSVMRSFTKYDMTNIINGGPLTIELHDSVFRNDMGIQKTALLVKTFIELGGHQLQINSVNRERLLDAQAHPENHPNLIVRVWGWSGYFNELDIEYQNHIVRRFEFGNL